MTPFSMEKIKTIEKLKKIVLDNKKSGKVVGFTNGCFDILHLGHVRYLKLAKSKCDILIVAVNSDNSVKKIKGEERPINKENARLEVISSLEAVNYTVIFDENTPEKLIKELTPDILFKGGDWNEDKVAGGDYVRAKGGSVMIIPFVNGYSTTEIIKKIGR